MKAIDVLLCLIGKGVTKLIHLLGFKSFELSDFEEEGIGFVVMVTLTVVVLLSWGG